MSKYDYYNKNKKPKLFSWATYLKTVGIILAGLIGVLGITILVLYLTGSFDEKRIPPDGIKIVLDENNENSTLKINNIDYYVPDIITDEESGDMYFSLTVADALKSVSDEAELARGSKATLKDVTVDISNEEVIKVKSDVSSLDKPIVFEVVKDANGHIRGGFATITIRSGDGVYGQVSQNVFIDVPVESVSNNLKTINTATGTGIVDDGAQVQVGYMLIGDELEVFKPNYTPEWSYNPTRIETNSDYNKIYRYSIQSYTLLPNGQYQWVQELELVYLNNVYSWQNTGSFFRLENKKIYANKKGIFRVSCSAYATYDDQNDERAELIQSDYTYYEVQDVSFTSLTSSISEHQFEYSMQYKVNNELKGVTNESELTEFRVYLNTTRTASNYINLGLMPVVPNGYNVSDARKLDALKDVYLNVDETISNYYKIVGDNTRLPEGNIYPINDYGDYYFSVKLLQLNTTKVPFTFKMSSGNAGVILSQTINFSMYDVASTLQIDNINQDKQSLYGNYLSMQISDNTINNEKVKYMQLVVDTNVDGADYYGVDLNKLVKNVAENGKTPSYWKMRFFIRLQTMGSSNNATEVASQMASGTVGNVVVLDNNVTGLEIVNGFFAPQAYQMYEIYAVLVKTDYNGEDIIDSASGTIKYRSVKLFIDVEIKLSSVVLTMCNESGAELDGTTINEGGTYYIKVEPNIAGSNISDTLLENYTDKLKINPVLLYPADSNKQKPFVIEDIKYRDSGLFNGYYAKIDITAMQSDTYQLDDYVRYIYFEALYDSKEQFGITNDAYFIHETLVRGVNLIINGARVSEDVHITFVADWDNNSKQVVWTCQDENMGSIVTDEYGKARKYSFGVEVLGDNTVTKYTLQGSSIRVEANNNTYDLYIADVLLENDIQLNIISAENESYYRTIYITLQTPQITFNTTTSEQGKKDSDEYLIQLDDSSYIGAKQLYGISVVGNSEVRKTGESNVYNHTVYNGDEINLKKFIIARIGSNVVSDMLTFEFENKTQVEQYATLNVDSEGLDSLGLVRFIKNPTAPQLITVQIKAFSYQINFMFLLQNNIDIKYSDITQFFNNSPKSATAGNITQDQIIMSYYNGAYYPTIIFDPIVEGSGSSAVYHTQIKLADLFTVIYKNKLDNSNNPVPVTTYMFKFMGTVNGVEIVNADNPSQAMLRTNANGIYSAPTTFSLAIESSDEDGKVSVAFTFLIVPNILIQSQTVQDIGEEQIIGVVSNSRLIKNKSELAVTETYQDNVEFALTTGTIYKAGVYQIAVPNVTYNLEYDDMFADGTAKETTIRNLLVKTREQDNRLFRLLNFNGGEFNSYNVDFGAYQTYLTNAIKAQSVSFEFAVDNSNNINLSDLVALTTGNDNLTLNVTKIISPISLKINMVVSFVTGNIVVPAQVTINPFYQIVLNTDISAVANAQLRALASPYKDVLTSSNAVVFHVQQQMLMNSLLKINVNYSGAEATELQTQANENYLNKFSYTVSTTDNQIKVQNNASSKTATLIANKFSSVTYSTVQVLYNGIKTGYTVYVFVCSNANIWQEQAGELVLDENYGLTVNTQTVGDKQIKPYQFNSNEEVNVASIPEYAWVDYTTTLKLAGAENLADNMFVLMGLDNAKVALNFAITNQEGYNLTTLNQNEGVLTFSQSAKDVLIVLQVTAQGKYYIEQTTNSDGEVVYQNKELTWVYYFKLKSTQTITVTYPYQNGVEVFNSIYEDDINLSTTIGVNGYIRLKPNDVLNVGDRESANCILRATNNINNSDIWSQLSFTVQYYNADAESWQDTNAYTLYYANNNQYLRSITIPGDISANCEFTRIHVTSQNSGVDAYINVRITADVDSAPTISYPSASITFVSDGKQYELRDKANLIAQNGDSVNLTGYDTSISLYRINTNNNSGKVYFETKCYDLNDNEVDYILASITNGVLTVKATEGYTQDSAVKIKVFMRSDYAYFTNQNELITYNIYYGKQIEIQPNYDHPQAVTEDGDTFIKCQIDPSGTNRLYLSSLFNVVALNGASINLTASNYDILNPHSIDGSEGEPNINYLVDGSGEIYIDYANATVPASGYSIMVELHIEGADSKQIEVRIFPSVATISNNDNSLNSIENPEIVACGETFTINTTSINYTGLDGQTLTYYLNGDEPTSGSWSITAPQNIYEPTINSYLITIKIGEIIVRKVTLYVNVLPTYNLQVLTGINASHNSNGYYANVYSGYKYNLVDYNNPMYFNLLKIDEDNHQYVVTTLSEDLNKYDLSFELLNLNGEFIKKLDFDGTNITTNGGAFLYGTVSGKVIDFAITAQDVLIRVTLTNHYYNGSNYGYAKQSILIKLNKNIDSSNIAFTSNDGQANAQTNPITLTASGVDLLQFISKFNLNSTTGLSSCYLNGNEFSLQKFFSAIKSVSTTFNSEGETADVLIVDCTQSGEVIVTKNQNFISSEATIHCITFSVLGEYLVTVYISIPRDFAYTFDTTFTTMYAGDTLDLSLLANSLVDFNQNTQGEGAIKYALVSTTAGNVEDYVQLSDNYLSVKPGKENIEQNVTLIAYYNANGNYLTAKAEVHILPQYSIESTTSVLYLGENVADYIETREGGVLKQDSTGVVQYTNLVKFDENENATELNDGSVVVNNYTYQQNTEQIIQINNSVTRGGVTTNNAIMYSPVATQDNLVASIDVPLDSYLGEFYFVAENNSLIKHTSISNVKYYTISDVIYNGNNTIGLTYCVDDLLRTHISTQEYTERILVEADVSFVINGVAYTKNNCYGVITLTIYPTLSLNTTYTHNAEVSVFKALKAYNLNDYIKVITLGGDSASKEAIRKGKLDFSSIKLFGKSGDNYQQITENLSSYYSLDKYVTIGEKTYRVKDVDEENNKCSLENIIDNSEEYSNVTYNNSYIVFNNLEYNVQNLLEFSDDAIGFSCIINVSYSLTINGRTEELKATYFIKVDVMDLDLVQLNNVTLTEGDEISYTTFVENNANANNATKVSFGNAGSSYYNVEEVDNKWVITNVGNIYAVQCLIDITFEYANSKTFVYTAKFTLLPKIQISYISYGQGEITSHQFAGQTTPNLLDFVNYTGADAYALDGKNSLLKAIDIKIITVDSGTPTGSGTSVSFGRTQNSENDSISYNSSDANSYYTIETNSAKNFALKFNDAYNDKTVTFTVTYRFEKNNQALNLVVTFYKVIATEEFSFNNISTGTEIIAGESTTISNVYASKNGESLENLDVKLVQVYSSDNNLLKVEKSFKDITTNGKTIKGADITITAVPIVTTTRERITTYITLVYIDEANDIFENASYPITINTLAESAVKGGGGTSSTISYPTINNNNIVHSTDNTYYEVYVENVLQNGANGTLTKQAALEKYFVQNGNNFTAKQSYFSHVSLYTYTKFTLKNLSGGAGQQIVLSNKLAITPQTPALSSVANGGELELAPTGEITLSASLGAIVACNYASGYNTSLGELNFSIANGVLTLTRNNAVNVNVPLTITLQSACNESYYYNVTIKCSNPSLALGSATYNTPNKEVADITDAFIGGYNAVWYVNHGENTFNALTSASALPHNAKYLICENASTSTIKNIETVTYSYQVYAINHTYDIVLGDLNYDAFTVYNSKPFNYNFGLKVDGKIVSGATYSIPDTPDTLLPIVSSTTGISFTPSSNVANNTKVTFTVNATMNNIVYSKTYSFTFLNGYSVPSNAINQTKPLPYDNGVVYSGAFNLVYLSNFTYTNSCGTVYTYTGGAITGSGITTSGNYLTCDYPTGEWKTDGEGYITGYKYNTVNVSFRIPVQARGDVDTNNDQVIRYIEYHYAISRSGCDLAERTNYKSAVQYADSVTLTNSNCNPQSITLNYTFPFGTTYKKDSIAAVGLETDIVYYVDFNVNNEGRIVDGRLYKTPNYYLTDIKFYSGATIAGSIQTNTCDGFYNVAPSVSDGINKTYTLTYKGYKITENCSFEGFVYVKVKVVIPVIGNVNSSETTKEFIVPVVYNKNGKNVDNSVKNQSDTLNSQETSSSTITNHKVEYLNGATSANDVATAYGVAVTDVVYDSVNHCYTFVNGSTRYIVYAINASVQKTETDSGLPQGDVLHGEDNNDQATGYKHKYQNIRLAINVDDDVDGITFTFTLYSNVNNNISTLSAYSDNPNIIDPYNDIDAGMANNGISAESSIINNFTSVVTGNSTTLSLAKYIVKKGLMVVNSAGGVYTFVADRDNNQIEQGDVAGITITSASGYNSWSFNGNKTVTYSGLTENEHCEPFTINGEQMYMVYVSFVETKAEYTQSLNMLTIAADSVYDVTLQDLGELNVTVGGGAPNNVLDSENGGDLNNLSLTSMNENVATISKTNARRIQTNFVLQDTYVTINAVYNTGKSSSISFHFDILVQASVTIKAKSDKVNVQSGASVDASNLFTIIRGGNEVALSSIANSSVEYYLNNTNEALTSNIITANNLQPYAGSVVPVIARFYINKGQSTEQKMDVSVSLNVEENLYQLNIIEDVYSLYAGQSLNLAYVHLKIQDANGYLISATPTINKITGEDNNVYYTISGTTITALHLFKDVRTSVIVEAIVNDKTYNCKLDLYLLQSYYAQNTYQIDTLYVEEKVNATDVINNSGVTITDYKGNVLTSVELNALFKFEFDLTTHNSFFTYTYSSYNASGTYNLQQTLYVLGAESGKVVHQIQVNIGQLVANRSLGYASGANANTIVMCEESSCNLISTLFNSYLTYTFVGKDEQVKLSWLNVTRSNVNGVTYTNGVLATANQKGEGFITHDTVQVTITDNDTKQTVTIYVALKRLSE